MAQDADLRLLETANDTKGWEGVGRLNIGSRAFCTGALIEPDLVLTAAHCLFDRTSGEPFDTFEMEFLAGWRNGRAAAYRGVKRALPHPEYRMDIEDQMGRVAYDVALLELDQPIRIPSVQPFTTDARPRKGDVVGIVSYALDRANAPSIQESCRVLARRPGILILSCDVDFGSSGAPIFTFHDGTPRIVSVVSAKSELNSHVVSIGSAIEAPLQELRQMLADQINLPPARIDPVVRRLGGSATQSGGAKFVRP